MNERSSVEAVDAAIGTRFSCRKFLPDAIPVEVVAEILSVAARAPSGHNAQPWKVHVMTGAALQRFCEAMTREFNDPELHRLHWENNDVYPTEWVAPYMERRRQTGRELYGLLGIQRGDTARMQEQMGKNYSFFGAPVGLIFTLDRWMARSIMDCGMFIQNIMTAARVRGIDTCAQAAFAIFHRAVRPALGLGEDQIVVCGMAMGRGDPADPVNRLRTGREPVTSFAVFHS